MEKTMGDVADEEFFCKVKFVYIYDTSVAVKRIRH